MEEDKKFSIEDNINLDEIKMLLGEEPEAETPKAPVADAAQPETVETLETPENTTPENGDEVFRVEFPPQPGTEEAKPENTGNPERKPLQEPKTAPEKKTPVRTGKKAKKEPQQPDKKEKDSFAYELYGMLHDVIYLLVAVTLLFVFVVRLVGVKGESMLPTLHNADFLLLESNFLYRGDDLEYGDVIVISAPYFEEQGEGPIVKRVIATEGQTIDIDFEHGLVYVDGVLLQESYINEPTYNNWVGENGLDYPATVPEGCVFVMGDNRNNSMDSRYAPIGMIDEDDVLGKVLFIVLPGETRNDAGEVTDARDWSRFGLVS